MAGSEQCENLVGFPPMDEASKKRRVQATEFVGKRLSSEFLMPLKEKVDNKKKEKMDKAKLVAVEAADGDRKRFSGAAAAETAMGKIQTEKMHMTVVEVLDGEKNPFSSITSAAPVETAVDSMQSEKMDKCADSDADAVSFITDLAKLLNESEEWIEKQTQRHRERGVLCKRIDAQFVKYRDEWITQGYVVADEDLANLEEAQEFSRELWKGSVYSDFSGLV